MSEETRAAAEADIDVLLQEKREFLPSPEFVRSAVVSDPAVYERADADLDDFWLARTGEFLSWATPPTQGLEWDPPHCTWFADGSLNVSANCLDRHVAAGKGDKVAYHFVSEPVDEDDRAITYAELLADVCRFANGLQALGIGKGDVVGLYMGMVPELAVTMLACARIGAPHVVVFGGFSAEALGERLESTGAKLLVTQDEAWRKGGRVPLKVTADAAAKLAPTVKHMVVLRRTGADVPMQAGRDHEWSEFVAGQADTCPAEPMEAEHMLFALHTSGTTAKPKAVVHTSGGYLTYVAVTHRWIFDIHEDDVYWCAADIGWVTGHSYIVYGPLANCTTGILYEGDPMHPGPERHWQIIERYGVTQYYTAPTLIRAFIKAGPQHPAAHDLSSLRLLGSVGEPINPEAWVWYWKFIGGERCPIVDTWWQTETGGVLITPLPGIVTTKPGSATRPFPGIRAAIVDERGDAVAPGNGGYLVITRPWPGMFRTLYKDDGRYVSNYFSKYGHRVYFPGDGARQDAEGDFWLLGRVDDVMNVSGHRLSTIELESTLVEHPAVAEAAATAAPDPLTGQTPLCFVLLRAGYEPSDELASELREWIGQKIGKIARPKAVIIVDDLPKTRSGKIMRRLLKDVAEGHELGDTTTLRDPAVVEDLKRKADAVLHPERLTRILLIRHAEPVAAAGSGEQNDRPLSAAGRAAAQALVAELAHEPIAAVYSSPYPRARQTVEPLAAARGLDVTIIADLRERLLSPGDLPDWEEHCRRGFGDFGYALAGGESAAAAQARGEAALAAIARTHPGETVAVASHGNLIALMLHTRDRSIGFAFWRAMPMPALYAIERE